MGQRGISKFWIKVNRLGSLTEIARVPEKSNPLLKWNLMRPSPSIHTQTALISIVWYYLSFTFIDWYLNFVFVGSGKANFKHDDEIHHRINSKKWSSRYNISLCIYLFLSNFSGKMISLIWEQSEQVEECHDELANLLPNFRIIKIYSVKREWSFGQILNINLIPFRTEG